MQEIYIDTKEVTNSHINLVQGDNNSDEYKLILVKDENRIDLTNKVVKLAFCNDDNKGDIINNLTILDPLKGEMLLPITNILSSNYGYYACQLAIFDNKSNFVEHSTYFTMSIQENLFIKIGEKIPPSTYQKLNSVLDAVAKLDSNLKELNKLTNELNTDIKEGKDLINSLGGIKDLTVFQKQINNLNTAFESFKNLYMSGKLLNDDYFNIAVIHETKNGLDYVEFWLLINAKYDHKTGRFKRINVDNFSFGWQMQAGGTYPGEENWGDFINQGMNLWKANGKKAYGANDPAREQTGEDIGVMVNGEWKVFGMMLGWNNSFMNDSYGGMTIGGAGFEIDGNGMSPFKRVSLGKFSGGSNDPNRKPEDYIFTYNGTTWNTQHGLFNMDKNDLDSYFWGMEAPVEWYDGNNFNPYSNSAKLSEAKYVIKHLPPKLNSHIENWSNIFEIDCKTGEGKIKGNPITTTVTVNVDIVNKTDFNMNYPDSTWNKDNTLILGVKGILADGTVKQFGNINATYTQYGIYGYLGAGYEAAKIIITKY
ncbi:MAG: BppU family phage baseplate upper protein [Clostridium baratii]|uniref:BppU family phage baseplate upper protein n=1 Tax=Clostridium baratii TaxID=1561 RepID=UPI002431FB5A|nr:BppU family phage baseplate upper protein [Clostridium baratii]MBS6006871.1 BppU family phage baseplate upper protein [Clostridium baratii]